MCHFWMHRVYTAFTTFTKNHYSALSLARMSPVPLARTDIRLPNQNYVTIPNSFILFSKTTRHFSALLKNNVATRITLLQKQNTNKHFRAIEFGTFDFEKIKNGG